jgi:hypothetical protein
MADLKYYDKERIRWPNLGTCKRIEAEEAILLWTKHYGQAPIRIEFTHGSRSSHFDSSRRRIRLNESGGILWITVAHEMAHALAPRGLGGRRRWHCAEHADYVDILCRWILREGWNKGSLAHELALKEVVSIQRDTVKELRQQERSAAMPSPVALRIMRREEQIKRLGTKIKGLTTRLKKAQRSLSALRRRHPQPS